MIMKQKILAMSVAAALTGGVVGTASAALTIVEGGVGHMLMIPYFTAQGGNSTLFNIINTDSVNGKAVKIRHRGGVDSDDIFDFQVFLSPGDVWTAAISQAGTGPAQLATSDKSCTLPQSVNAAFITARLLSYTDPAGVAHDNNEQTREGYVEIFNTADIPPLLPGGTANPLFTTIKHVAGVPPCTQTTLLNIEANAIAGSWVSDIAGAAVTNVKATYTAGQQLAVPTATLMGNWTIINVPSTLAFTGAMPAISASTTTRIVYSGQTGTAVTATPAAFDSAVSGRSFPYVNQTADGVLVNANQGATYTGVLTAKYDFPDMSTPYEWGTVDPITQASILSTSYIRNAVMNEFLTDASLQAATDWTISLATRRYHVAGRGANYAGAASVPTTGAGAGWTVGEAVQGIFGGVTPPYTTASVTYAANGRSSCVATGAAPVFWDREETTSGPSGAVISPGTPTLYSLCGEVNVLAWNNTATASQALKATLILANSSAGSTTAGWGRVALPGLPAIGSAHMKIFNSAVSAGLSGNFGGTWPHRYQ